MNFKNEFSWSKSRDEVFNECKRKYYFNHYGFWGGWDPASPDKIRELYVLKNLSSRHIWIGQVVHDIIKYCLPQQRCDLHFVDKRSRSFFKRYFLYFLLTSSKPSSLLAL